MALERPRPSINQDKIDVIKREMKFEQFIRQLPPDKRVILDWPALLSEIKDEEGVVWRMRKGDEPGLFQVHHGELTTRLLSDKNNVHLNIHSLSLGQEDAIDLALFISTNSNAPFVPYKYEPQCFSTLCLVPRQTNTGKSVIFVYGNIAVDLTHYGSDYNVLPLARALHAAMQKAVAANPDGKLPARPHISYAVDRTPIKVGETFTVTAKCGGGARLDPGTFDVAQDVVSDNIEYEKDLGNGVYKFTAKAAGIGTVAFSLLDKKTLWVFTDTVTVHIDPK